MSPQTEWKDMLDEMEHDKDSSTSNKKYWQPPSDKEGTFPIRILPPLAKTKGEKKFYFKHLIHWIDRVPYECLTQDLVDKNGKEHKGEECPICAFTKKLYRTSEKNSDGWKLAGELRAKMRYDYRIIVRNTPDNQSDETKPVFYETGSTIYDMLYHIMKETDFGIIVDPKAGRDFNLVKKGLKRQSRYDQSLPSPQVTPIHNDTEKLRAVMDNAAKLNYSQLIEFVSVEEMDKSLRSYIGGDKPVAASPRETKTDKEFHSEEKKSDAMSEIPQDAEDQIDKILEEF
jgi:hypothetical protein